MQRMRRCFTPISCLVSPVLEALVAFLRTCGTLAYSSIALTASSGWCSFLSSSLHGTRPPFNNYFLFFSASTRATWTQHHSSLVFALICSELLLCHFARLGISFSIASLSAYPLFNSARATSTLRSNSGILL